MEARPDADSAGTGDGAILFRTLLDEGNLAVGVADASGRLVLRSRALRTLAGSTAALATTSDLPELLQLFDAEGTERLDPEELPLSRAARGETVRDAVISVRRPGAQVRYLRCDAAPVTGQEGLEQGAIVHVTDITAEHAAVSRQDRIRSLLLDTVNHELRTPLTIVIANAELIVDADLDLPEQVRGPLSAILRASDHLQDTIRQVSDLVDLESAALAVRTDIGVRELLLAVRDSRSNQAGARTNYVEVECPRSLRRKLDPVLVARAVGAMLDNALTHGPGGSEVTLAAGVTGSFLHLRVTDAGKGIPAHDQDRLTKPFERGGAMTHHLPHSRGLGLSIAHAVATSHQGALLLENHQPSGFTASLVLG